MSEITKEIIDRAILENSEFTAGANLCANGEPCPMNASEQMIRGYAREYAIEQQEDSASGNY